jgi:hypothetical protein
MAAVLLPMLASLALACRSESAADLSPREATVVVVPMRECPRTEASAVETPEAVPTPGPESMPGQVGATSMQAAEPDASLYTRPPVHQTDSPRLSNVGMPYPIPSADLNVMPPLTAPPTPPRASPPSFPETTVGPPAYQVPNGFPESSFGADAAPP